MGDAKQEGSGASHVGRIGIVAVTTYLVVLSSVLLYCLFVLWPRSTTSQIAAPEASREAVQRVADSSPPSANLDPASASASKAGHTAVSSGQLVPPDPSEVSFVTWRISISEETRLLLLVVCAGALGSLVHGFRSLYWYFGNRALFGVGFRSI
jgi:hypothetical protein